MEIGSGDVPIMKRPCGAALIGNWQEMSDYFKDQCFPLVHCPMTLSDDTALHISVHSQKKQPLEDLLDILKNAYEPGVGMPEEAVLKMNSYGNNVLHEATTAGNLEAVKLLVKCCPDSVSVKNRWGETPLFTAAAFADKAIVKYLIQALGEKIIEHDDNGCQLLQVHRRREFDGASILQAAIQGQHFETALLLLDVDESLQDIKSNSNLTALELLATMPSAFKSGSGPMDIIKGLFYCCLPVDCNVEQEETREYGRQQQDLESGQGKSRRGLLNHFPRGKEQQIFSTTEDIEMTVETSGGGENALFRAARNGIEQIVFETIVEHPQAVWQVNEKEQSILDLAVIHRQEEIFNLVKQLKAPLLHRLKRVIDSHGNTLLHHVANVDHYSGGSKPGPAFQLQEELIWFERVQDVIPAHYVTIKNNDDKTAKELFEGNHKDQLEKAQNWIKKTSQSCSTVAALVATVVFAAAYAVPGGANDRGVAHLIDYPYFLIFTVSDVVSLASSLTSLAVFLSVLTSPFELNDFRRSLPRRLKIGLTLLFFSVITTMLAFGSTIFMLIQSDKKLTAFVISFAAFVPVLVFAMMQFHMYTALLGSTRKIIPEKIRKAFSPGWEKKLKRKFSTH